MRSTRYGRHGAGQLAEILRLHAVRQHDIDQLAERSDLHALLHQQLWGGGQVAGLLELEHVDGAQCALVGDARGAGQRLLFTT